MRSYKDLLKEYIESSGLSLSQIEQKLREKGLSTNKTYISKLQNGKLPPAGDEINRALADVLGGDAEELVLIAYAEKAPVLYDLIDVLSSTFMTLIINNKDMVIEMMGHFIDTSMFEQQNIENFLIAYASSMGIKDKIEMISYVSDSLKGQSLKDFAQLDQGVLRIDALNLITQDLQKSNSPELSVNNNLTEDEQIFLNEQLELYRKLKLQKVIKTE
ncbi:helix-turn-helix domain-containing protein [Paenibacillus elgii]|uniref:helix-turn-helix domain-containing protein n=1 Tax=Paenibacillus elgii TaxID=189691 RepID=UPI0020419BF6|nr:helix-turn-helix transcriptional regulator [Paenibacillus elgii]MCM3274211.1 helix-turn-helix transcriptional regulator [Paenibacillus elgii]